MRRARACSHKYFLHDFSAVIFLKCKITFFDMFIGRKLYNKCPIRLPTKIINHNSLILQGFKSRFDSLRIHITSNLFHPATNFPYNVIAFSCFTFTFLLAILNATKISLAGARIALGIFSNFGSTYATPCS